MLKNVPVPIDSLTKVEKPPRNMPVIWGKVIWGHKLNQQSSQIVGGKKDKSKLTPSFFMVVRAQSRGPEYLT